MIPAKQAPEPLTLSALPPMPTKDEQLRVLRLAVEALLLHGQRPDIVAQAEHALHISSQPTKLNWAHRQPQTLEARRGNAPTLLERFTLKQHEAPAGGAT